jgi:hypothetical protein
MLLAKSLYCLFCAETFSHRFARWRKSFSLLSDSAPKSPRASSRFDLVEMRDRIIVGAIAYSRDWVILEMSISLRQPMSGSVLSQTSDLPYKASVSRRGQRATIGAEYERTRQSDGLLRGYWRNCRLSDFPRYLDGQEQCERKWREKGINSGDLRVWMDEIVALVDAGGDWLAYRILHCTCIECLGLSGLFPQSHTHKFDSTAKVRHVLERSRIGGYPETKYTGSRNYPRTGDLTDSHRPSFS